MAEALWSGVAGAYDRSFATLCAGAVPVLVDRLAGYGRVLDVGCGSGHLTAALVAAGHEVEALDLDPEMVALTRHRSGVPARVVGAGDLPVDLGRFDAVAASFVLNHVDLPAATTAAMAAALEPGGRLVATTWTSAPTPHGELFGRVLREAGAVLPTFPRLAPELDFERSPDGLAGLAAAAGLVVADAFLHSWEWEIAADDLFAGLTRVGNFGVAWQAQEMAVQQRALDLWADEAPEVGTYPVVCAVVVADRADGPAPVGTVRG